MVETISGTINLLNIEGDSVRPINVDIGSEAQTIEGEFGSLIIDSWVINPPKIQGKGNVWILNGDNNPVRTRRIIKGEVVKVVISGKKDGSQFVPIGEIKYQVER